MKKIANITYRILPTTSFSAKEYQQVRSVIHSNSEMEFILVYEGIVDLNINGTEYQINQGEGIFILPYEIHDFHSSKHNVCHVIMCYEPYSTLFSEYVSSNLPKTRVFPLDHSLQSYIRHQLSTYTMDNTLHRHSILFPLFDAVAANCEFYSDKQFSKLYFDTLTYINQHLIEPITEKQIAEALFVHPASLSRSFSKYAGMNIKKYMNLRRIFLAHEALKQGIPVTEIAFEVGFGSIRNFNRVFMDTFHYPPSEVKKQQDEDGFSKVFL